jgi:hypothetical protein
VKPVNDAPVAVADAATVPENDYIPEIYVLFNDYDPDKDGFGIDFFTQPKNGTVEMQGGAFSYVPKANFHGTDSFTYQIRDDYGILSNVATVTVTVIP